MATPSIDAGDLVPALARWEKMIALRGDARVPLDSVEEISVGETP